MSINNKFKTQQKIALIFELIQAGMKLRDMEIEGLIILPMNR